MQFQFSAGVVLFRIINNQYEYLLLHYPHGHWDLPKGKIEQGETKQEAALRELQEETGLSAQLIDNFEDHFDYFFKQNGILIKKTVYFLIGKAYPGEVILSDEHIGYIWLSYEDALQQLSFENARRVLSNAQKYIAAHNLVQKENL